MNAGIYGLFWMFFLRDSNPPIRIEIVAKLPWYHVVVTDGEHGFTVGKV